MFGSAVKATTALEEALAQLDPAALDGPDALQLFEAFDRAARLGAAGRALCAARIEETEAWRGTGHRDAPGFLAARMGGHRSEARDALAVGARMSEAQEFAAAVRSGRLSEAQAAEIAETLASRPEAEAELLGAARTATMRELRAACNEIASRGTGAEERQARAQEQRFCSSGVGRDGRWRLSAGLTTLDGALVGKVLDMFQNEVFDDARAQGRQEPFTAYRADALVRMARAAIAGGIDWQADRPERSDEPETTEGSPRRRQRRRRRGRPQKRSSSIRHAIIVTVPHTIFRTGAAFEGETCQVPGVGPVPVSHVQKLLDDDPIIKCVVTAGRDITATATMSRTIKEDLRLAVLHSHNWQCAVPGCTSTRFVELDHELEFTRAGPTAYDNLRPLCSYHHRQRTNDDYELVGKPGEYRWLAPDGRVLAADPSARRPPDPATDDPLPSPEGDPDLNPSAEHSLVHEPAPA